MSASGAEGLAGGVGVGVEHTNGKLTYDGRDFILLRAGILKEVQVH